MGGSVMDLLDRAEDHRRGALDRPAHQVPWAVAVLYFCEPLFDRHEFAVRAGGHVTASQNAGQRVWRGIELQAQDVGKSAFAGFDDGAGVMGDQPAQHGVGVLGVAQVTGAVQGVQARHGHAGGAADVVQSRGGFQEAGVGARTGARLRARAATPWTCAQRRGRGSWRSAWARCPAREASAVMRLRLGSRGGTFTDLACRLKTSSDASARSSAMHAGLNEAASAASVIPRVPAAAPRSRRRSSPAALAC